MSNNIGIKILLTGLSNCGKTNALKTLDPDTSLVINIDGKTFPLAIPHYNYTSFPGMEAFLYTGWEDDDGNHVLAISEVIEKFIEQTGKPPATIAVDTVSRIFNIITDYNNRNHKGFDVHTNISKDIALFNTFVQESLVESGINVVSLTHVTFDEKTNTYIDASSGAYKRAGGAISVHDNVSFFSIKNKKYQVQHRGPGLPCRTLLNEEQLPSVQPADDYSLSDQIAVLSSSTAEVEKFSFN